MPKADKAVAGKAAVKRNRFITLSGGDRPVKSPGVIANGLALSKVGAYQAGFLIFSDFQRGALRLSALMELPVIHLHTHDSIGVGEDGPTHQPVEQLASFRAMPGLIDLRPGDATKLPPRGGLPVGFIDETVGVRKFLCHIARHRKGRPVRGRDEPVRGLTHHRRLVPVVAGASRTERLRW